MQRIFSYRGEENWSSYDNPTEALQDMEDDEALEVGKTFLTGIRTDPSPTRYFIDAEEALENYDNRIGDEHHWDYTEGNTGSDTVTKEAKKELDSYLKSWADRNLNITFFEIEHDEEITVTQEMIDAFHAGKDIPLPPFKFTVPEQPEAPKPTFTPNMETQNRIIKWFAESRTGMSSECMAYTIGLQQIGQCTASPYDPSDLWRCLKLLEAVPELRNGLEIMREVSPIWDAIIDRWDDLEVCLLSEIGSLENERWSAPKTYEMLSVIRHLAQE